MADIPVIAIDGPSGTGKGTVSGILATNLNWHLLDSGSLYRVLALSALNHAIALDDKENLVHLLTTLDLRFESASEYTGSRIIINNQDVSEDIRQEAVGNAASLVAALPEVRRTLLERQRDFRQPPGLVADGRDMGTIVFPDAQLKIFLTASAAERATRRYKQLIGKGISVNLRDLSADIAERDRRDKERAASPLRPAEDAVEIDTTGIQIQQVVTRISALVEERFGTQPGFTH